MLEANYTATIEYTDGTIETFDSQRYEVQTSPDECFVLVYAALQPNRPLVLAVPREQVKLVRIQEEG